MDAKQQADSAEQHRLHKPGVVGSSPTAAISPGVEWNYADAKTYHGYRRVNASRLKSLHSSALVYAEEYVHGTAPNKESDALRWGTLVHLWAEQWPNFSADTLAVAEPSMVTATGSLSAAKSKEWVASLREDQFPVTPVEEQRFWRQVAQIENNPAAVELFEASPERLREFNLLFEWLGVECKCRIDGATPDCIYDIKTTRDAHPPSQFGRSAANWHYHIQAAFYLHAAKLAGWKHHSPKFIVTSNVYPFHCSVMHFPEEVLAHADELCESLLQELTLRQRLNWWTPRDYGTSVEIPARFFGLTGGNRW